MAKIRLIAGLGNVGKQYERTRHNVGFDAVDLITSRLGVKVNKKKFGALFADVEFESGLVSGDEFTSGKLILVKPAMFMNNSGQAVATVAGFYKIPPEHILVITDDMALDCGMIRLRQTGSAGGHNGLIDIIDKLGSKQFNRLRIGIGSSGRIPGRNYVLARPDEDQRGLIDQAIERSAQAAMLWLERGPKAVMNKFNRKRSDSGGKESQDEN